MSLKEIFCQDKVISLLQRAFFADKMAHAYIFAWIEGIGKFTTASQWSKLLLCEKFVSEEGFADSCGSSESCRSFEAGAHPDFKVVYKELREFTKKGKGKPKSDKQIAKEETKKKDVKEEKPIVILEMKSISITSEF